MYSCYRKDEAFNPDVFLTAAAAILSEYSEAVIRYVTDPRTGLPSRQKWPPQASEIKEACEDRRIYLLERAKREAGPYREPIPREPIAMRQAKARDEFVGHPVLAENITPEQFQDRAKKQEFPAGSRYVAILGTVYGPKFTYGQDDGRRPPKESGE